MATFEFELIENESLERNPEDPFKWEYPSVVTIKAYDFEDAIKEEFFQAYIRSLNDLVEYDFKVKKGKAIYENAHDGSYLTFTITKTAEEAKLY